MGKLFWGIITVTGIAILFWICCLLVASRDATQWIQTKGQVVSSLLTIDHLPKFVDLRDDPTRWYGSDVLYEYSVGDITYLSNKVSMNDGSVRSPQSALKVMNKYRHQHEVTVYFNPSNPKQAVLEPWNIGDIYLQLMVGGLFTILGLFYFYEHSLETKPWGVDNHLRWGSIYQKQGKLDLALGEFNKVIELNPHMIQGYKSRGGFYLEQGNWDLAIADYIEANYIDPTDASVYFNRAQAYLGNKQYDKALVDIEKAQEKGFKVKPEILQEIKKGLI